MAAEAITIRVSLQETKKCSGEVYYSEPEGAMLSSFEGAG
jgi:hypothetical protein